MMPNHILTKEQRESVQSARIHLQHSMEIPLHVCAYSDGWKDLSQQFDDAASGVAQHWLSLLPKQTPQRPEPFLVALEQGGHIVGIPIESTLHAAVFGVGLSDSGSVPLLKAVSVQCKQIREFEEERAQESSRIDSYTDQILHDFEERNWLIQLTNHLEMCEVNRGLEEVVSNLLPRLKSIVNAESVAYVPESAGSLIRLLRRSSAICTGTPVHEDLLAVLVQRFRRKAVAQPLILNWYRDFDCGEPIPTIRSLMMMAVQRNSQIIGWLLCVNKLTDLNAPFKMPPPQDDPQFSDFGFGTTEAGLFRAAASVLATHHHNLSLFQSNQNLTIGAVRSLANAVDARDSYTHGHSDRVGRMARHLAMRCGESKLFCDQILMTGLLHDIGKIGVPDRVLLKPDRLNDEELAIIRQHPRTGHQILKHISELNYTLDGVLHHHEAWNGTGYPDGLKEDAIPRAARILAVVDTFDAMTTNRPYRDGASFEKAESILSGGSGVFWDPAVVDVFMTYKDEFRSICRDSPDHSLSIYGSNVSAEHDFAEDSVVEFEVVAPTLASSAIQ